MNLFVDRAVAVAVAVGFAVSVSVAVTVVAGNTLVAPRCLVWSGGSGGFLAPFRTDPQQI